MSSMSVRTTVALITFLCAKYKIPQVYAEVTLIDSQGPTTWVFKMCQN